MRILIDFALLFLMIHNAVKLAYGVLTKRRVKKSLWASLRCKISQIPPRKEGRIRIWIHAVSYGETRAIEAFAQRIKGDLPDIEIIKTSVTETGQAESLKRRDLFDHSFYLPIDFSFRAKKVIEKVDPDLFILVENDYWPNLLMALKAHGTKIALVNGRMSLKTYKRYQLWPTFANKLFNTFDILCVQSDDYKSRFESLGVAPEKIAVTGNIKFDATQMLTPQLELIFPNHRHIVTIASTHEGEEEVILEALSSVEDSVCLLIAPRHPERFEKVGQLLKNRQIAYRKIQEKGRGDEKVVLIDKMGLLDECFKISHAAIIGVSFVKDVGGHNIFEPIRLGIPVIFGPYMFNQTPLVELFRKHEVGQQVELAHLKETLERCLREGFISDQAKLLIDEVAGATERSWELIKKL